MKLESTMSANNTASTTNRAEVVRALAMVRNVSDPSQIPDAAKATVDKAQRELWQRLTANPDYTMNDDEFSLFNFHRTQYSTGTNSGISQRATARYWNSRAANGAR